MSIAVSIARTIKRLNLQSFIMKLPVFGQALYDGLAEEFDRVNDFRTLVNNSVVVNENMDVSTITDYETKYGIIEDVTINDEDRIDRIIERAQRDGNGGPDWIQDQIQQSGLDLYVILNDLPYTDPDTVDGILIASSPNGNIGGTPTPGIGYPEPKQFTITSDPDRWGYFFFLSPFPDRIALLAELPEITNDQFNFLVKTVIQLKHTRNWCIAQVTSSLDMITTDSLDMITSDDFDMVTS